MGTDLLLLNCSNLPWRPIFPYAFVQVSEVARRFGLRVRRFDMLGVRRELWSPLLRRLIGREAPRMVGVHLRQADSVALHDYYPAGRLGGGRSFFPVDDARDLIAELRRLTRAPVVMGGIGFTTHARRLLRHLELDYGVEGCPDGFFERFEDVVAGRDLDSVPNLLRPGAAGPPRAYYDPSPGLEYTDELIDELVAFYGQGEIYGKNPPTVAVEVMRGCPFRCYFCTEPHVKGRRMAYRDLDVVVEELRGLLRRGLSRVWFVCSELNIQGPDFALALAERVIKLNEERLGPPLEWSGYSLPTIAPADLKALRRAGYVGALNDVLSLDDANLKRAGVPYRSKQAVAFLKGASALAGEERASAPSAPQAEGEARFVATTPKELGGMLVLFLGNAHADAQTIRTTLRRVEEEGLRGDYDSGHVIASSRVFDLPGARTCGPDDLLITFGRDGERPVDVVSPTFSFPKFLIDALQTPEQVLAFFSFVADTFMSTAGRRKKDWAWFLASATDAPSLGRLLALSNLVPPPAELAPIFEAGPASEAGVELLRPAFAAPSGAGLAALVLRHLFENHPRAVASVLDRMGVAHEGGAVTTSEYRILERLYARYRSTGELCESVLAGLGAPAGSVEALYLRWFVYQYSVIIRPEYGPLLFDHAAEGAAPALAG